MKNRLLAFTTFAILLLAAGLAAQSPIAGKWRGQTPNGASLELNLTVTDNTLTGTLTREDTTVRVTEGKVSKNRFTFTVSLNDEVETISGEVDGDQMKAWLDRQGPSMAVVFTRVK